MTVGDRIEVGDLMVWKTEAGEWVVFSPDREPAVVTEEPTARFGLSGLEFAVDAVLDAEQRADLDPVVLTAGPEGMPW